MSQAIGNTPPVRLRRVVPPQSPDVFLKLEYCNPTGSYRDRMALSMIEEAEAREMAWRLARTEWVFAGTSSGMNVVGARMLARDLGPGHTVVTVAVDSALKYLSGHLFGRDTP